MNFAGAPYWDLATTILYIIMGLIPVWAIYESDKSTTVYRKWWKNPYFIVWIIIWTIFGGGRLVTFNVGGTDAPFYIEYFESCLNPASVRTGVMAQYNSNVGFRWLNKFLRLFSSNGYFFIVVTSFLLTVIPIYFISKFRLKEESCIPYFLMVFWFVRGFCTIRSHLAIVTFLIALWFLFIGKKKWALIIGIYSILLHPMLAMYFPFIVILCISKKFTLGLKTVSLIFIISFSVIAPIKQIFLQNISLFGDYSEHYEWYASSAAGVGFFENAWKIAFEQILLLLFMIISNKGLKKYANKLNGIQLDTYNFVYKLCIYDFMLVPFCYGLGVWRGYEVCYIPRLIMWSIIVYIGAKKFPRTMRWAYNFVVVALFMAWFLQRTSSESFWQETALMPYVFAPSLVFF